MVHFHCMICTIGITKRLFQLLFFFLRGKDLLKKFNRPSGDHQSISFTCISHRLKLARALIPRRCLSFFSYTCKDCFFFFFFFFSYKSARRSFFFFSSASNEDEIKSRIKNLRSSLHWHTREKCV